MVVFRQLANEDWRRLRDIRLNALRESPDYFLSEYSKEQEFSAERWRAEFSRGEWTIGSIDGQDVCLLGVTREEHTPPSECWLEYMWVDPAYRSRGIAFILVAHALNRLFQNGVKLIRLWVLDGNNRAVSLYKSLRFEFNGTEEPLDDFGKPGRREQQMDLALTQEILDEARRRPVPALAAS